MIVSEYPAPNGECARYGFAVVIPFLTVCGPLLLRAHLYSACHTPHTPHTVLVEPMKRNLPHLEGVGLGAVPCVPSSPVGSSPNTSLCSVKPVDVCTVVLYASIMNGSRSSQLSCSRDTNMANIASRVLLKRSTNQSLRGWYGVVFVFTVPSNSESLCTMVLSNRLGDKPPCTW